MRESITHPEVPVTPEAQGACLGPDGSVAHVSRVLGMIGGRWKLPILFRLFAGAALRTSQLLNDIPGVSQKMLIQHLRELERDGLVARRDLARQPPHVEYALTLLGWRLMPTLIAMRDFSRLPTGGAEAGRD